MLRYQPQLFRNGFRFAASAHIQLIQNMADMRFHRCQLDIHGLADLCVALVRTDQAEDLQFRGRQILPQGQAGL